MKLLPAIALGLGLTGCLSTGESLYGKLDTTPPRIAGIVPPMGGDAGVPSLSPAQFIELTFSEAMDLDSLRAGIVIRNKDRKEQPLTIQVDPDQLRPMSLKALEDGGNSNVEFKVQISAADPGGFATGPYQLILRTLLIDQRGNGLDGEFLGAFFVQF